eukprot:scaffold26777_cov101-Isochrysis_galbana.AAC.5
MAHGAWLLRSTVQSKLQLFVLLNAARMLDLNIYIYLSSTHLDVHIHYMHTCTCAGARRSQQQHFF